MLDGSKSWRDFIILVYPFWVFASCIQRASFQSKSVGV